MTLILFADVETVFDSIRRKLGVIRGSLFGNPVRAYQQLEDCERLMDELEERLKARPQGDQ